MPHFRLGLLAFVGAATLGLTLAHPGQVLWMDENMPWGDEWQEPMHEEWQEPEEEWNDMPSAEEPWHEEEVWNEPMPEEVWNDMPAEEEIWPDEVWQENAEEPWGDQPAEEEEWPEEPWNEQQNEEEPWEEQLMEESWEEQLIEEVWNSSESWMDEPMPIEESWHDAAGSEPCEDCSMGGWSSSSEASEPTECEGMPDGEPCKDGVCLHEICTEEVLIEQTSDTTASDVPEISPGGRSSTSQNSSDTAHLSSASSTSNSETPGGSCDACRGLTYEECSSEVNCEARVGPDTSRCVHRPTDWCNDNLRCYDCRDAKDETECAARGCILDFDTATCMPKPDENIMCDDPAECLSCSGRSPAECDDASCMLEQNIQRDFTCAPKADRCPLACFLCSYEEVPACNGVRADMCHAAHTDCNTTIDGVCESRFKQYCEHKEQEFIRNHIDGTEIKTLVLPERDAPRQSTAKWADLFQNCTSMDYQKDGHSYETHCDAFLRTTSACVQALPSCSTFSIKNHGCRTFKNYGEVERWAENLRQTLPQGVSVSVQGEQALSSPACTTSTTITVDCEGVTTALPSCHSPKEDCYEPEKEPAVDCKDPATGMIRKEICCLPAPTFLTTSLGGTPLGHWAKGDSCPSPKLELCDVGGEECPADRGIHTHTRCLRKYDMETVEDSACCRIAPDLPKTIYRHMRNCPAFTCKAQGSAMTCGGATTEAAKNAVTACGTEQQTECERNGGMLETVCTDATINTGFLWGCTVERKCTLQCITDRIPDEGGDDGGGWED